MATEEQIFLNAHGALVSANRVVLGGTTYATRNISSVRVAATDRKILLPLLIFLVGLLWAGTAASKSNWEQVVYGSIPLLIGGFVLFTGKTTWAVYLTTNSGEVRGSSSKDRPQIEAISNAIISAISQR